MCLLCLQPLKIKDPVLLPYFIFNSFSLSWCLTFSYISCFLLSESKNHSGFKVSSKVSSNRFCSDAMFRLWDEKTEVNEWTSDPPSFFFPLPNCLWYFALTEANVTLKWSTENGGRWDGGYSLAEPATELMMIGPS